MITYTMNDAEVFGQIETDLPELLAFVDSRDSKYRRAVLKTRRYPLYFKPLEKVTRPGNRWLVLFEAKSRADKHDSRVTFVCVADSPRGYYAFMPTSTNGKLHLVMYQPHFFSRYRARFKKKEHGIELIAEFFKLNYSYVYQYKDTFINGSGLIREVYGSTAHGVAMGVITVNEHVFFRTFVTYDMLKGEQIPDFTQNEKIRQEIHENI